MIVDKSFKSSFKAKKTYFISTGMSSTKNNDDAVSFS